MAGTVLDDTLTAPGEAPVAPITFPPELRVAGRYRIIRFLAAGGMGIVHEAEDLLLGGHVALKALRPDHVSASSVERLRREVALARRVTHPNVCRLHDVGEHEGRVFFTMELLPGDTLAARLAGGPLATDARTRIAGELIDGLEALHAAGVIHRDLKPSNVLFAHDGRAVLTDFGLAREATGGDPALSRESSLLGTPAYMAPEQVEGRDVTAACDLYTLGVVLFEMATGALPFRGDTAMALATARLHQEPLRPRAVRPDLEPAWEATILHCLARDPAARPARIEDVRTALAAPSRLSRRFLLTAAGASAGVLAVGAGAMALWPARRPGAKPIATLALVPSRPPAEDDRLVALMTDLYDAMTGLPGLEVVGRESAARLGAAGDPVREAADLADAVIRIELTGDDETWTIDATRDGWHARRTRPAVEAPLLVADVVAAIAGAIGRRPPAAPADAVALPRGVYGRYGRAIARSLGGDHDGLATIVADAPRLTRARARLAVALAEAYNTRGSKGVALVDRARAEAERTLAEDPGAALAFAARAMAGTARWDWASAEADGARAIALAPRHDQIRAQRASQLMLVSRFDDALPLARRNAVLDPWSYAAQDHLGWCLCLARRFDEAIHQLEHAATLVDDPARRSETLGFVAVAQSELARHTDALATIGRARALGPSPYTLAQLATVYATIGHRDEARRLLRQLEATGVEPFVLGWVHAAVGDTDTALPMFERLVAEHDPHAVLLKIAFLPQPLRAHPRFAALIKTVGFPP